ncbi:MAG: hypothetical protein ACP5MZ_03795, partial [Candidatus Micrarchaeia archaeon]
MAFAGKNRAEETKGGEISKELNKNINSFVGTVSSMLEVSTIKDNLKKEVDDKNAKIKEHKDDLENKMKDAGISDYKEIEKKTEEYNAKLENIKKLRELVEEKTKEFKDVTNDLDNKQKEEDSKRKQSEDTSITAAQRDELNKDLAELNKSISELLDENEKKNAELKAARNELDKAKPEEEDANKHLDLFKEITSIRESISKESSELKVLSSLAKNPNAALNKLINDGINLGEETLKDELKNIKTEAEAVKFLKDNDRFNKAVILSENFDNFLKAVNEAQELAEKQGKKMEAEFAQTAWERLKGRVGPHIGRKSSSDISQKRVSGINEIIDDIASNPEVLQDVGRAYLLISVLGKLNSNVREKASSDKLKKDLEPTLNTIKEYLSNYNSNTREIKEKIGAAPKSSKSEAKEQASTSSSSKNATESTEGTYYGWKSKSAMNVWLNELDHYLTVNPKQKAIVESEYKKYEAEIKSKKLTMEHALQLYTSVISAKADILKEDRNEETHFNHATKHLVGMFNKETDMEKKKELADMIYRIDLAYTASISKWESSERNVHNEVIKTFEQLNTLLQSMYP